MSTDRPDLLTLDGRDHAQAAAEAICAINNITGWPGRGMTYPSGAYSVLGNLSAVAGMLPQACVQITEQIRVWDSADHIGIALGTKFADQPARAAGLAVGSLAAGEQEAREVFAGVSDAAAALANAHWTGPDRYIAIVDHRPEAGQRPSDAVAGGGEA